MSSSVGLIRFGVSNDSGPDVLLITLNLVKGWMFYQLEGQLISIPTNCCWAQGKRADIWGETELLVASNVTAWPKLQQHELGGYRRLIPCFVFWLRYHIFKYPIAIQGDQKPKAGQCTFWNRLPENLQVTSFYKHGSEKKGLNFLGPKVRILKFTYLESSHQIRQLGYKQNLCLFFLFSKKCLQDQCVLERLRC